MKVNIWIRKDDVNVFSITKGRHVGFWFKEPDREDVVQISITKDEYQYLIDNL